MAILNNFVSIRRTRGDVLNPAQFRSIVEMIRGILKQYDYAGLNDEYQSFLAHLVDYNDPHHDTLTDFSGEIITRTYAIYVKMTATPLSLDDFKIDIVPTLGFLELIRRIVLNRYLYDTIKNLDGSVPHTVTVTLGQDWGHNVNPNIPVTVTFPGTPLNEDQFIACGINTNSTPIPVVFNADNLTLDPYKTDVIFHTSSSAAYFTHEDTGGGYPISLFGSSNDFSIDISVAGYPLTTTSIFSMLNGTNTFDIAMKPDRSVQLKLDNTVIAASLPCSDGGLILTMTKDGSIDITTVNNSIAVVNHYDIDFSDVATFVTGMVNIPVENVFSSLFSIRELSVTKDTYMVEPAPSILPIVVTMVPAPTLPVTGSSSVSSHTSALAAKPGYYLYLTLTGTWTGTVNVQSSDDTGTSWNTLTTLEGTSSSSYTQNCDEAVLLVSRPGVIYRLDITVATGAVTYRLAQ